MIDSLTKDLLNRIGKEINKEENILNINDKIFNPLLKKFKNSIIPYFRILLGMYFLVIVLSIITIILTLR